MEVGSHLKISTFKGLWTWLQAKGHYTSAVLYMPYIPNSVRRTKYNTILIVMMAKGCLSLLIFVITTL